MLKNVLKNLNCFKTSFLVLDNVKFHNNAFVKNLMATLGAKIIFNSPYSPDGNPIEMGFSVWKNHVLDKIYLC